MNVPVQQVAGIFGGESPKRSQTGDSKPERIKRIVRTEDRTEETKTWVKPNRGSFWCKKRLSAGRSDLKSDTGKTKRTHMGGR